jgi:dGTPase
MKDLYERLLTGQRRQPSSKPGRSLIDEADSDRGRVLFSSPFRRLQGKTQVFALEPNHAVRTRLTHSLEVASIGRYLGDSVARRLEEEGQLTNGESVRAFVTFVETACLLHDIGNPPFGHFGEGVITDWFSGHKAKFEELLEVDRDNELWKSLYADFERFDGNPQGFRIVTLLQWNRDDKGLNLTHTLLAGMLKYPWCPDVVGQEINGKEVRKAGVFQSERETLRETQAALSLPEMRRHPLSYLMEAADDISYCLSDIEDAIEKEIVTPEKFTAEIRRTFAGRSGQLATTIIEAANNMEKQSLADIGDPFVHFRTAMSNSLVTAATNRFVNSRAQIQIGEYFSLLAGDSDAKHLLDVVRNFAEKNIYCSEFVRGRELIAQRVIGGLLDAFEPILRLKASKFEDARSAAKNGRRVAGLGIEPALVNLLARKYMRAYEHSKSLAGGAGDHEIREWAARAHLIVDYISGMTDEFATTMFQKICLGKQ